MHLFTYKKLVEMTDLRCYPVAGSPLMSSRTQLHNLEKVYLTQEGIERFERGPFTP
jgi:hypothetical protein